MKKLVVVICLGMALSGCASAKLVPLPDGTTGYVVKNCKDMAVCYKKAAEVCGGKYEVIERSSGQVGAMSGANGYLSGASSLRYTMTIRCENQEGSKSQ